MSVTPPPTYSPPKQEVNLTANLADLKDALAQVTKPIEKPEVGKKHFNVENPTPVNVFNYTGAVFDDDAEEYEFAEFLVSILTNSLSSRLTVSPFSPRSRS
jgi:hypothetical protein